MRDGELTEKEREILRRLLQEKEIREYEIVLPIGEGRELPGSTYEDEIESISSIVVTATAVYGFWLDWIHDHYTLGDEKGNWYQVKMEEQELRDIAIAEILDPTFALTKQFLAVNKIVFKENLPFIEDIILKEEEKVAEVYFPIEGERYYFVVYVDVKPQISVRWMGMSPGNRVYFLATSEKHNLDELIALIGVEPTRTWKKGKNIRHNGFEIQPSAKETGEVEDKLQAVIRLLLPFKADLQALSTIANTGIQIAYWGYKEQMWGMHFGAETLQELGVLNLSVDIDLYAGGPDLGES